MYISCKEYLQFQFLPENTLHLHYKDQSFNAVYSEYFVKIYSGAVG